MKRNIYILIFCFCSLSFLKAQFNYYYGNIHSQTSYSDGNKDSATSLITTPLQAFNYANQSQQIDFYGISDHNHLSAGMTSPAHFHMGIADANTANTDGSFVALYGQEWGVISGGGHAIVYGMDSLMGWDAGDYDIYVPQSNYATLWSKVNARPGVFAYLAHPQQTDYTNLFTTALNAAADNAIVGMAARSGPAFSTNNTYSDPSTSDYIARYQEALSLGYHLGVGLDHDTHNSVFGRQTAGRLVVAAPALTRHNILDAMRKMRFYSSDDWNVKVNFSINTQPMGSIYTHSGTPTISVNISDPDAESTASISVYYGVPGSGSLPTVLTTAANTNSLTYNHSIVNLSTYYYYLEIKQADGDVIWTSPIWYKRDDLVTASPPATIFSITGTTHCVGQPIALSDLSTNTPTVWSWSMIGATTNSSTAQNPTITYTAAGTYSIVLIASNGIGTGLPVTKTLTVGNPVSLTVTATNNTVCAGSTVTLTANGASTYTWSTGATIPTTTVSPAITTVYSVTGSSGGCASAKSVTVVVSGSPTLTVNSPTICSSGAATLTASGASTYTWNTGATNSSIIVNPSSTTVYTVTGKNGVCQTVKTTTVTVNNSPAVTVNSPTLCNGGTATLNASGASSYLWNTGSTTASISVSPAATTLYTVTGTAGGCSSSKTATVTVISSPTITVNSATVCSGGAATLSATGASTYSWNTGSTNAVVNVSPPATTVYTVTGTTAGCGASKTTTVTVIPNPTVSVNSAMLCSGGSATLTASGANSYMWNTGSTMASIVISPSTTTTYTITGTSSGCSQQKTTTITVNATPTLNVSNPVICLGNAATVTASGANTYSWNTGATTAAIIVNPNSTTQYTVTGNNNGCNASQTAIVTVSNSINVSVNSTTMCSGNSVVLAAAGASSYSWNTGATSSTISVSPAQTSTYLVTGSSGSCNSSKTSTVTVYTTPTVTIASSANSICAGGTISFTASGAATYSWNTGATTTVIVVSPPNSTVYSATGISPNNCVSTSNKSITVNPLPTLNVTSSSNTICAGQNVTLTASGASTYSWSTGSNNSSVVVSPSTTTTYSVAGTGSNACSKGISFTENVSVCTEVALLSNIESNIAIFPNPTEGMFNVKLSSTLENLSIEIYTSSGQLIHNQSIADENTLVDLGRFSRGIFLVRVLSNSSLVKQVRIVRQ